MVDYNVDELIAKAEAESFLTKDEIAAVLQADEAQAQRLFAAARRVRAARFGDRVFLYGFVYFSTWCRNNCSFCFFRRENDAKTIRYRKQADEVRAIAAGLAEAGVHTLDLTMGEDPLYHREHFASVLELTAQIVRDNGLPVMVSPGVVADDIIDGFAQAGATWYALYQETMDRELFARLRLQQSYEERLHAKRRAHEAGMLVEEGLLVGAGETTAQLAASLSAMGEVKAAQRRAMTFVPQTGTPMEQLVPSGPQTELKVIALLRLLYPEVLIPSSLDVEGADGLETRINAGANVVTSIIPPASGLAGVAQSTMDVAEGNRTVAGVTPRLEKLGLTVGSHEEYRRVLAALHDEKS